MKKLLRTCCLGCLYKVRRIRIYLKCEKAVAIDNMNSVSSTENYLLTYCLHFEKVTYTIKLVIFV